MSEFSIYTDKINTFSLYENNSSVSSTGNSSTPSIWGNNIVQDKEDDKTKKKEEEAKKAGYKSTDNPDTFYDKTKKVYYRWNAKENKFDALNDAKKVYEDGSYLTNDKKHVLNNGSVHDKNQKKYFNSEGKEIKEADFEAERLGYEKTANNHVYFDKKTKQYYKYFQNNSLYKTMNPVSVEKMLPSGAYITESGITYDKDNNYSYTDKNGVKKYYTNDRMPIENESGIRNFEARVKGYSSTSKDNCFYDKANKAYLQWNKETRTFEKTDIQDMTQNGAVKKGDKYYTKDGKEISLKEFVQNKRNLQDTGKQGIVKDIKTNSLYTWNEAKADFEKFDPDAKRKEFLASKPDGEVGNYAQGEVGDCWLLAATKTLDQTPQGKKAIKDSLTTDAQGNITVDLKGVGKKYSFTNEELTKIAEKNKYSSGDKDMLAIELAFEKYRKEISDNNQTSPNRDNLRYLGMHTPDDPLDNGRTKLAIEILTGKGVSTISRSNDKNVVYKDNTAILKKMDENTLKPIFDNKNNLISVEIAGADKNRPGAAHAFTFKGYDEKNVYLINPYDTSKVETMSKEEFYANLHEVSYTQLDKPLDKQRANAYFGRMTESPEVKKYLESKRAAY